MAELPKEQEDNPGVRGLFLDAGRQAFLHEAGFNRTDWSGGRTDAEVPYGGHPVGSPGYTL